jgi:hypothetical protein
MFLHLDYLNQWQKLILKDCTFEKVISESVPFNIVAYPNPSTSYFGAVNGGSNENSEEGMTFLVD